MIYNLIWMFFIYSFLGWCVEVIYAACETGKFVNRGFLNGTVCPIYGLGATGIITCLSSFKDSIIILFVLSVLMTSLLELGTGWLLERFFKQKWWDYSNFPLNFKGYICLKFSLLWGVACVSVIKIVHPVVENFIGIIPKEVGINILILFTVILCADFLITFIFVLNIKKMHKLAEEFAAAIRKVSDTIGNELFEGTINIKSKNDKLFLLLNEKRDEAEAVWIKYRDKLKIKSLMVNRLTNAFPDLKATGDKLIANTSSLYKTLDKFFKNRKK